MSITRMRRGESARDERGKGRAWGVTATSSKEGLKRRWQLCIEFGASGGLGEHFYPERGPWIGAKPTPLASRQEDGYRRRTLKGILGSHGWVTRRMIVRMLK